MLWIITFDEKKRERELMFALDQVDLEYLLIDQCQYSEIQAK